jgi:hypothetical protein
MLKKMILISYVCNNWAWKDIHVGTSFLRLREALRVGLFTVRGARSTYGTCRCLTPYLNLKVIKLYYCK